MRGGRHLDPILVLTAGGVLLATALLGAAEITLGLTGGWSAGTLVALSIAGYGLVGIATPASSLAQYLVAGRSVSALHNGLATGAAWVSAASFVSLAGALSVLGFAGLAYVTGLTGGCLLLGVLIGPHLRRFGGQTVPEFLGARFGRGAHLLGIVATIACSFGFLAAQLAAISLVVSWVLGVDPAVGGFAALLGLLACSVLGGMRSVTATQVAQSIVVLVAYLAPVAWLSWTTLGLPVPGLVYGRLLEQNSSRIIVATRDAGEAETRRLWMTEALEAQAKILAGELSPAEVEAARDRVATALRQAVPPSPASSLSRERHLAAPTGLGMWQFLALALSLAIGTAGLPHILARSYTTPTVRQARASIGWALAFVGLIHAAAPAYAAFERFAILTDLVGRRVADVPAWITSWQRAGFLALVDKNGDGVVQLADLVVRSADFVVLALPEIGGLPPAVSGLVLAGCVAAALSTGSGLLLALAAALAHDLPAAIRPPGPVDPRVATLRYSGVGVAVVAGAAAASHPAAAIELGTWTFSLAGASIFPVVVAGIWWRGATAAGATAGLATGLLVTAYYQIGSRLLGVSWLGTPPIAAAVFGLPAGCLAMWLVSRVTAAAAKPDPGERL